MSKDFSVIIPARLSSTRLPGKVLLDIGGKPLIQHVYEAASLSDASRVVIATDDSKIQATVSSFGAECVMTSPEHQSGTDRLAEAAEILQLPDDSVVVNVQGDEYGLPSALINQLGGILLSDTAVPMATLCEKILTDDGRDDHAVVKVVFNQAGLALYFSRYAIPWRKKNSPDTVYRHIGIYAYRVNFLKIFTALPVCNIERQESLEQLRALYYGYPIRVDVALANAGVGIDTDKDLEYARKIAG